MSFFEDIFLFPVRILMKTMWMMMPLFLIIFAFALIFHYPYTLVSYIAGFLIAPIVLRRAGIYHVDVTNSLGAIALKNQELKLSEAQYQTELNKLSKKHQRIERRLQNKIQLLTEETMELGHRYTEILDREPDRIIYYQPDSFLQRIKTRLSFLRRD